MNDQGERDQRESYWQPQPPVQGAAAPDIPPVLTVPDYTPASPIAPVAPSRYAGFELTATEPEPASNLTLSSDGDAVAWQASEYVHHEKSLSWFVFLGIGAFAIAGLALIFMQWTFAILVVVMAVVVAVFARRPPRELRYQVGPSGVSVETKHYDYANFRAFGVMQDGPLFSIVLLPAKRFAMSLTMYFSESDGEKIFDVLASYLPHEDIQPDLIDRLTKRLRF